MKKKIIIILEIVFLIVLGSFFYMQHMQKENKLLKKNYDNYAGVYYLDQYNTNNQEQEWHLNRNGTWKNENKKYGIFTIDNGKIIFYVEYKIGNQNKSNEVSAYSKYKTGTIKNKKIKIDDFTYSIKSLERPTNLRIFDDLVIWDPVKSATSYDVYFDGILHSTVSNSRIKISNTYYNDKKVSIKAKNDYGNINNNESSMSDTVTFSKTLFSSNEEQKIILSSYSDYNIGSNIRQVRITGENGRFFQNVRVVISQRNNPLNIILENVNIQQNSNYPIIETYSNIKSLITIESKGTSNQLIAKSGASGNNSRKDGIDGEYAIDVTNLYIKGTSPIKIIGGSGGSGFNGANGTFASNGENGGNGGSGFPAVNAETLYLRDDVSNITLIGGRAGSFGKGGASGTFSKAGTSGRVGETKSPTYILKKYSDFGKNWN